VEQNDQWTLTGLDVVQPLIADMVVYLLRDEGRGLSGRVIRIDAGDRLGPARR